MAQNILGAIDENNKFDISNNRDIQSLGKDDELYETESEECIHYDSNPLVWS